MKMITLHQPWATLVIKGEKKIETRSWPTKHRGPLGIHASLKLDNLAFDEIFRRIKEYPFPACFLDKMRNLEFPLGYILGTVEIYDCQPTEAIKAPDYYEAILGDFGIDRYAWFLRHPHEYEVRIPARGKQGLWTWARSRGID